MIKFLSVIRQRTDFRSKQRDSSYGVALAVFTQATKAVLYQSSLYQGSAPKCFHGRMKGPCIMRMFSY